MASRSVSPGARLLRSSRMFSIPPPIAEAGNDYATAKTSWSPTASAPYPTRLSITSPYSSRMTGDWGFKRPLPKKTTTKQTMPVIRVRQVDSIEHITDFRSATDHTMTLRKFQELHLPISQPPSNPNNTYVAVSNPKSVFEEDRDFTAIKPGTEQELESKRWRFGGPWLAGMADGDFEGYLQRAVLPKRQEFRAYLRETLAAELHANQIQKHREETPNLPKPTPIDPDSITDEQLLQYSKQLRQNDRLELYRLVSQFLDLAPVALNSKMPLLGNIKPNIENELYDAGPYGVNGPPKSHPSAGLSYLRTRSFQENHHLYGPQRYHSPVKARILKPKNTASGSFNPVFGVAGFIPESSFGDSVFNASKMSNRAKDTDALFNLDPNNTTGSKMYVQPAMANLNTVGRIAIRVQEASEMSKLVKKEMMGEANVYEDSLKAVNQEIPMNPVNSRVKWTNSNAPTNMFKRFSAGSQGSYGIGERDL